MLTRKLTLTILSGTLLAHLLFVGCRSNDCSCVGRCQDIPRGAIPQPLGTAVCQWQHAQMDLADRDGFVVYENEWLGTSANLTPFGTRHLAKISSRLPATTHPVVIQPSADPTVNEARQQFVIDSLSAAGLSNAHERVQVNQPLAEGLYGFEAPTVSRGWTSSNASASSQPTSGGNSGFGNNSR